MRRVMIVGGVGSGKSTLACALGVPTGFPLFHMDHMPWCPEWQARPRVERRAKVVDGEGKVAWVFEGGSMVSC